MKHLHIYTYNLKHLHTNKTFIKLNDKLNTWYVHEQVKCDQVCKHYISCKHNLIKQVQSLKNDYNEHLASKCSFGHAMQ